MKDSVEIKPSQELQTVNKNTNPSPKKLRRSVSFENQSSSQTMNLSRQALVMLDLLLNLGMVEVSIQL